jgi:hypothetical protein
LGRSEAAAILKTARAGADPRMILIEWIIPETPEYSFSKWGDLYMLAMTVGQEGTPKEYRRLLEQAEWRLASAGIPLCCRPQPDRQPA